MSFGKKINILDLRDSPWVDGPGRTILDCASSIEGEKFHFVIGAFSGGGQKTNAYVEEAQKRNLEVVSIPEKSAIDWRVVPFLMNVIETYDIDIIHTHDFRSDLMGLVCAKLKRKPIIVTTHGWIANNFKGKIYCSMDRFLLRFFEHIISVSERTRQIILKTGIPVEKTSVVNNALKLENYQVKSEEQVIRKELGINSNTILIANIGRLSPEKGQFEFLIAARKILKHYKDIRFLLIGIGPDESKLKQYVSDAGMGEYVIFTGYRADMVDVYNSVDLVVQSSFTEGMPNVILEALLMEVPVIATDVGGTAEIVIDGANGVLIPPGNVDMLVGKINDFLIDREKYLDFGKKGRQTIENKFDHAKRVKNIAQLYSNLVNA